METDQPVQSARPVQPTDSQSPKEAKKKKRHIGLWIFLIVCILIILGVVVAFGATGAYNLPVVSALMGTSKPKNLGVKSSPEALASLEKKMPVTIKKDFADYSTPDKAFVGKVSINAQRTSEEITSFLNRFAGSNATFTDTQVRFNEGGFEVSTMAHYPIDIPAYADVQVTRTSPKSVDIVVRKGKVGMINVPEKYLRQAEEWFEERVNARMQEIDGYSIEKLEYHDGYSLFVGTYPKTIYSNDRGWSGLFF